MVLYSRQEVQVAQAVHGAREVPVAGFPEEEDHQAEVVLQEAGNSLILASTG